jgi:HAD superfamily hydrolase (TIGR01509 family)
MLRGVIFDMDGVVIDSHPVHRRAWSQFLQSIDQPFTDEQLDFILEGRRRDEILRHFLGDIPEEQVARYGELKESFFRRNVEEVGLMPGVSRLLSELQAAGLKSALATSASSRRTYETLARLGLEEFFAAVLTGDDVMAGKPDPEIYLSACRILGLPAEQLMVLEDAPCGVRAARAAGLCCLGVAANGRGAALKEAGAHHVITNFQSCSFSDLKRLWEMSSPAMLSPAWEKPLVTSNRLG